MGKPEVFIEWSAKNFHPPEMRKIAARIEIFELSRMTNLNVCEANPTKAIALDGLPGFVSN